MGDGRLKEDDGERHNIANVVVSFTRHGKARTTGYSGAYLH
jgi:hypothetical protein